MRRQFALNSFLNSSYDIQIAKHLPLLANNFLHLGVLFMRNRIALMPILLILFLAAVGCSPKPAVSPSPGSHTEPALTPSQQELDLPDNFSLAVDIEAISPPAQVSRYFGKDIIADEAAMRSILTERNPGGDYKISVQPRTLLLRDRNSKTYGRLINLARLIPGEGTLAYVQNGAMNNEDFRAWESIDNLPPLETALSELKELFSAAGLENLTAVEAYALDSEVLKAHEIKFAELLDQNLAEGEAPYKVYDWGADDSCYLVIYTNQIDGIPLYYRKNLNIGNKVILLAYAYAFYGKDGLIGMEGYGLYEKGAAETTGDPLSVESILDIFLTDMRKPIHVPGTKLTAMELCYLPLPTEENVDLVPIWAFEVTSQGLDRPSPDPYPRTFVGLYDAFSGEIYDVR